MYSKYLIQIKIRYIYSYIQFYILKKLKVYLHLFTFYYIFFK